MNKLFVVISVMVLTSSLVLSGCSRPAETEIETIRLPMGFVANVQFAPWYVAVDKGYFAEEGIELTFDYSWETDGVRLVGAGELPFAIASGDQVILGRAQDLPIVTAFNWWRRFPVSIVALEESGIQSPADLVGRTVGIPETFGASYIGWRAFATTVGLAEDDVQLEVIGYTQLANLTEGRVDAVVVYANNEPVQLAQRGYDFVEFAVSDYDTLVSNGLISNEETLRERRSFARAFIRAFHRGLADTLDDPDAAFDICYKYVEGLEENEQIQRAVLEASLEYWRGDPLGASELAAWQETADVMRSAGLVDEPLDVNEAFTNDYLP